MRHIFLLRVFFIWAVISAPALVLADDEITFSYQMCMRGIYSDSTIPKSEVEKMCSCTANKMKGELNKKQQLLIRDFTNRMRLRQEMPITALQKSGIPLLIETSHEYCMDILWPVPEKISDEDHIKYSSMADKSIKEFTIIKDARCKKYRESKERSQCLTDVSRYWLKVNGDKYSGIPKSYISGNDLANALLGNIE